MTNSLFALSGVLLQSRTSGVHLTPEQLLSLAVEVHDAGVLATRMETALDLIVADSIAHTAHTGRVVRLHPALAVIAGGRV